MTVVAAAPGVLGVPSSRRAADENAQRLYTLRRDGHTYRVINSLILGEHFEALAAIGTPSSRCLCMSRLEELRQESFDKTSCSRSSGECGARCVLH